MATGMLSNPSRYQGLLGQGDREAAAWSGLRAMSAALLDAGAPSTIPRGWAPVAKGLLAFDEGSDRYGDTLFNRPRQLEQHRAAP